MSETDKEIQRLEKELEKAVLDFNNDASPANQAKMFSAIGALNEAQEKVQEAKDQANKKKELIRLQKAVQAATAAFFENDTQENYDKMMDASRALDEAKFADQPQTIISTPFDLQPAAPPKHVIHKKKRTWWDSIVEWVENLF